MRLGDYFEFGGVVFGICLALVSYYLGDIIVQAVNILSQVSSWILKALLFIFQLPLMIANKITFLGGMKVLAAVIVGIIIGPLVYKLFVGLFKLFKRLPL